MPRIQANRDAIDDRFSVLGFTVRSESPLFEVGVATDPALFRADRKAARNRRNFFSSRAAGVLRARRGEAVYLLPPDVLANFVGQQKLYFGLATYRENSKGTPDYVQAPGAGNMYVNVGGLTERGLRRLTTSSRLNSYGPTNGHDASLEWGGDAWPQPAASAPTNGSAKQAPAAATAPAAPAPYDDGFGQFPDAGAAAPAPSPAVPATAQALQRPVRRGVSRYALPFSSDASDDSDSRGIEGPIPDDAVVAAPPAALALSAPSPEYPQASRFVPAAPQNYRAMATPRTIDKIVLHITDGGANINGTISWFQNPQAQVSAHYVIGQDGEVVQMVRHNDKAWHASSANSTSIGIEHVANTRGLMPTGAQLCASAALVTWLCDQYGIAPDRVHILGHSEADPHTSHTGCPNAVWNWEHYMRMVETRSCIEPAAALALGLSGRRRPLVQAQEIITPFYDPANPMSALTCQNDAFSLAREEWFVGVPNTRMFPHSAICKLEMTGPDGSVYGGTGFYIGRKRVLTCAHNLHNMSRVVVTPGSNGLGDAPYGSCTVQSAGWRIAPGYRGSGDWDRDLAVIDNVPIEAPGGHWFEFLNATPSTHMPIVVCGYSAQSDAVPELTQAIDGERQHLHGGYANSQSNPEVIEYGILTLKGASGSPVYHLASNASGELTAGVTAVHVSGEPAPQGLNRGCFITPQKIDWIEGRATAFGLGLPVRAMQATQAIAARRPRAVARAQEIITPFYDPADPGSALSCQNDAFSLAREEWFVGVGNTRIFPHSSICKLRMTAPDGKTYGGTGFYIASNRILTCAHNLDGMARVQVIPGRNGSSDAPYGTCTIEKPATGWRIAPNYSGDGDWANDLAVLDNVPLSAPNGQWFGFLNATPSDRMPVVVCGYSKGSVTVPALTAAMDGEKQHLHGGYVQGQSGFDVIEYPLLTLKGNSGSPVYHLSEASGALEALVCAVHVTGEPAAQGLNRGCFITPQKIDWIEGRTTSFSLGVPARAMSTISCHWDDVPYYPQSSPMSCWAASAAMVVGWRDRVSIPDSEIARMVPAIDAYRTGLWPRDRRQLADAWNLVAEPPASYTIEAWAQMLQAYGPLYIDMTWSGTSGGHVRVLVGMESDGNADGSGTTMYMHDPWPDTPGRIKLSFADFLALYENRTGNSGGNLEYQILHADRIPEGVQPVTAAPFALTLADEAEPALSHGAAPAPQPAPSGRLPAPPAPIVQQQGLRARGLSVEDEGVVVAESPIVGTTLRRVSGSNGEVSWQLDQLSGLKYPDDASPAVAAALLDAPAVSLIDWPHVEAADGTQVRLDLGIDWQYDGSALGNVRIKPLGAVTSNGTRLVVTARIADHRERYPRDNPGCAALDVNVDYQFTRADGSTAGAAYAVRLFGNGRHNAAGRWLTA